MNHILNCWHIKKYQILETCCLANSFPRAAAFLKSSREFSLSPSSLRRRPLWTNASDAVLPTLFDNKIAFSRSSYASENKDTTHQRSVHQSSKKRKEFHFDLHQYAYISGYNLWGLRCMTDKRDVSLQKFCLVSVTIFHENSLPFRLGLI